jgi:hypothetical protein
MTVLNPQNSSSLGQNSASFDVGDQSVPVTAVDSWIYRRKAVAQIERTMNPMRDDDLPRVERLKLPTVL